MTPTDTILDPIKHPWRVFADGNFVRRFSNAPCAAMSAMDIVNDTHGRVAIHLEHPVHGIYGQHEVRGIAEMRIGTAVLDEWMARQPTRA